MNIEESHELARRRFWEWVYQQETQDEVEHRLQEIEISCEVIRERIEDMQAAWMEGDW